MVKKRRRSLVEDSQGRAWEHTDGSQAARAWESDQPSVPNKEQDDAVNAGAAILSFLRDCYMQTDKLSAKDFCICCHWLSRLGVEDANAYAMRPNRPTGHYQRFLDVSLGSSSKTSKLMPMYVPGQEKYALGRSTQRILAAPPHED